MTPRLTMVVGLPGTGKTTFARALARDIGATHLNSDIIRANLGLRGKYSDADKEQVYGSLLNRATELLRDGKSVIVDATLYRERLRRPYSALAKELDCPIRWIEMRAAAKAVRARTAQHRAYSEADFAVHEQIKEEYQPIQEEYLILHSDEQEVPHLVDTARKYLLIE